MKVDLEVDPNIEEFETDTECPYCHKGYNWEDIKAKMQPADLAGMLRFLLNQTGEDFSDWNITECYHLLCTCGRGSIIAEVPEACDPDENGICASAYMTLSLEKDEKPEEETDDLL